MAGSRRDEMKVRADVLGDKWTRLVSVGVIMTRAPESVTNTDSMAHKTTGPLTCHIRTSNTAISSSILGPALFLSWNFSYSLEDMRVVVIEDQK